ncbi:MAG: hypothetical protein AAFX44_05485 [Pseudomonadota bacterium]
MESRGEAEVTEYCEGVYQRTYELWRSLEDQFPTWGCRFGILYGPPSFRPDLLIVGRNPGFNPDDLFDEEVVTWPSENEYIRKHWPLAKKLRMVFDDAGKGSLLANSLGTNKLFFKSKSIAREKSGLGWQDNPLAIRQRLEGFCSKELTNLIDFLEPKTVLALGLSVFDEMADSTDRDLLSFKNRRLARFGSSNGRPMIGVIHPTGARVSNEDWSIVASELSRELSNQ